MKKTSIALAVTGAVLVAGLGTVPAASAFGSAKAVGLAGGGTTLVTFDPERPSRSAGHHKVTGLVQDTALIGIDYRVQDGELYGVGNQGGIYLLEARRGTAVLQDRPRVTLDGSNAYGVDFNPAANALRIVSSGGANLRVPFATAAAAIVDGPLTRPAIAPATGTVPATGVTAAAYTNNDLDASTATTLFVIDTERDQVAIQSPANAGSTAPTGALGADVSGDIGFDIYSDLRWGKTTKIKAYAVVGSTVHRVDLLTGEAPAIGKLRVSGVTDIAVALDD